MSLVKSKIALLFSGQGSSLNPDHIRSFYDNDAEVRQIFDTMSYDMGSRRTIRELCLEGGEELQDTRYAQVCIYLTSLAIAKTLQRLGIRPDVVAGLSLGEYCALAFAGSFTLNDGVRLLVERGRIMSREIPEDSSMASILGLEVAQVQVYCDEAAKFGSCEIATYLTRQRMVITGNNNAVDYVVRLCSEHKRAKAIKLETSRAFHSCLAKSAADAFSAALDEMGFTFESPNMPLYYNVDGKMNHTNIAAIEVAQFYEPVQLEQTLKNMYRDGVRQVIAIGPGVSMAGCAREVAKDQSVQVQVYVVETYNDAYKLVDKMDVI